MKRDKKGIKEKLVKWIKRITGKEIRNIEIITQKNVIFLNYH